jgi:hypothetical protein
MSIKPELLKDVVCPYCYSPEINYRFNEPSEVIICNECGRAFYKHEAINLSKFSRKGASYHDKSIK